MGEPFGKASGRTFSTRSTDVPDPFWNPLWVISSNSLKMSNELPRRKQRGINRNIFDFLAASGGELTPERLEFLEIGSLLEVKRMIIQFL